MVLEGLEKYILEPSGRRLVGYEEALKSQEQQAPSDDSDSDEAAAGSSETDEEAV
jgi:hypothetical protein